MKPAVPDELVVHVVRHNSVAFVGAGLSAGLGLPDWPRLIRQMIDWCESQGIDLPNKSDIEVLIDVRRDLPAAANVLRAKMGDAAYRRFLEEVFLRPDLKPTEVHKILARIPFAGAGTTNYDALVEEAYREAHPGEDFSVFTHDEHEQLGTALNANRYFVLKAHGTVERPETIVLDTKAYGELLYRSEGYRTFLRAMFLDRTALFLGFSMTDPDLLSLLRQLKVIFEGHTPTHYALMDVSHTTQTEQELFEETYGVKIIPYTPSAADYPEVKAFLTELGETVTRSAVWHQAEALRKAAEVDDPHYRAVATSDGEIIIKERYPGASEAAPLGLSITVNQTGYEAIKRTIDRGEPLNIRGEDIIDVKVPDIMGRFFKATEHLGVTSGVARGEKKITFKAVMRCADGEEVSLDNIVFENVQGGRKQMILSNENQDVPWKFRQVIRFDEDESDLTFSLDDVGQPTKRALEGLRFSRALSKGGHFHFEDVETGDRFAHAELAAGLYPPPDDLVIRMLEALELIREKTGVKFTSPPYVSSAEVENIFAVERILRTGRIGMNPPSITYTDPETAKADIERFSRGATLSLLQYSDEWVFVILGKHVLLGPVLVSCEKMVVPPEDLEALKGAVESGLSADKPVEARLAPAPGESLEAKLLNWLPAEEAERLRNLPFVKTTSFNNFVKLLADSAKQDDGALNIEEFMSLLDCAKGETSEQGALLNRLSSATEEELGEALEQVAADLEPDTKLELAQSLFERGWLSAGRAAQLARVDEKILMSEQD